jgi:hypothetical protein
MEQPLGAGSIETSVFMGRVGVSQDSDTPREFHSDTSKKEPHNKNRPREPEPKDRNLYAHPSYCSTLTADTADSDTIACACLSSAIASPLAPAQFVSRVR